MVGPLVYTQLAEVRFLYRVRRVKQDGIMRQAVTLYG